MVYSRSVLFVVAVVVGNSEQGTMDRVRSGRVGAECRVQDGKRWHIKTKPMVVGRD